MTGSTVARLAIQRSNCSGRISAPKTSPGAPSIATVCRMSPVIGAEKSQRTGARPLSRWRRRFSSARNQKSSRV